MLNDVNLIGHVGKDLVKKTTPKGTSVFEFSMATTKGSKEHRKTDWHKCVAYGKTADILAQYLKVGSKLFVNGEISYNEFIPKNETKKVKRMAITVEKFQLLDSKDDNADKSKLTSTPVQVTMDDMQDIPF